LTYLSLSSNDLSGIIPESIGNLTSLTYLSLSSNDLSGIIPESIGNLTSLTNLNLSYNDLSGIIPESICNISNPSNISLDYNNLCPPYIDCIETNNIENQNCILGCMDQNAFNFDENANNQDESCLYNKYISPGNNLISFQGVPAPHLTFEFFNELPVNFVLGQGVGLFKVDDNWSGNLSEFDGLSAYWINASEPFELEYNIPDPLDKCADYLLNIGNNLISYIGQNNEPTLFALGGYNDLANDINFILGQGQGLFNTAGEWGGNLVNMYNGNGYWLNLKSSWPYENESGNKVFRWGIGEECSVPENSILSKIN